MRSVFTAAAGPPLLFPPLLALRAGFLAARDRPLDCCCASTLGCGGICANHRLSASLVRSKTRPAAFAAAKRCVRTSAAARVCSRTNSSSCSTSSCSANAALSGATRDCAECSSSHGAIVRALGATAALGAAFARFAALALLLLLLLLLVAARFATLPPPLLLLLLPPPAPLAAAVDADASRLRRIVRISALRMSEAFVVES